MPPFYDIYSLSKNRDRQTIEQFLNHYCVRDKIENRAGQEIMVYENEKYQTEEINIPIKTLTEVIDYGIAHPNHGFTFYISDHLKGEITGIILKFTYDGKFIFGLSVEEKNTQLQDNYDLAQKIAKEMTELTASYKTAIQLEYAPPDDEDEFDEIQNIE